MSTNVFFINNPLNNMPWIHGLKPVPVGVVSDVLIFWVIGEFRVFQHPKLPNDPEDK